MLSREVNGTGQEQNNDAIQDQNGRHNGPEQEQELNELLAVRRNKLNTLRELGFDPFGKKFDRSHHASDILSEYDGMDNEELEKLNVEVSIAGRVMQVRKMGKAGFAHVQDQSGRIQIYVRKDAVSENEYEAFKLLDLGDLVGVRGHEIGRAHV